MLDANGHLRPGSALDQAPEPQSEGGGLGRRISAWLSAYWLTWLLLAWFVFQAVFSALTVTVGIPPDEITHLDTIRLHAEYGLSPVIATQTGFFHLGDVTRDPDFLYHYLLSFPFRLSPLSEYETAVILRLVNVAMVAVGLWIWVLVMRRLGISRLITNVALAVVSNTMMLVVLAGSVNYDNQLFLLSSLAFLLFVRLLQRPTLVATIMLLGVGAGMVLTKISAVPLVLLMGIGALVGLRGRYGELIDRARDEWRDSPAVVATSLAMLIALVGLVGVRYGLNLIEYQSLTVACDDVHSVEQCEQWPIFVRNRQLWQDAPPVEQRVGLVSFGFQWLDTMRIRSFGFFGHMKVPPPALADLASLMVLGLTCVGIARGPHRNRLASRVLGIGIVYVGILFWVNRATYMATGVFGLALQGRYAFPVYPILVAVGIDLAMSGGRVNGHARAVVGLLVVAAFALSGLPAFLYATGPEWFDGPLATIATHLGNAIRALIPDAPFL